MSDMTKFYDIVQALNEIRTNKNTDVVDNTLQFIRELVWENIHLRNGAIDDFFSKIKDALTKYEADVKWFENGKWVSDSKTFVKHVCMPGGLIDRITQEWKR